MIRTKFKWVKALSFLLIPLLLIVVIRIGILRDLPFEFFRSAGKLITRPAAFTGISIVTIILAFFLAMGLIAQQFDIDSFSRVIRVKNLITRKEIRYNFLDFDGFVEIDLAHRSVRSKTIGLVKNKRMVHYIDSFYISNYKEVVEALQSLPRLGTFTYSFWRQIKFLLRQPFIE